MYVLGIHIGHDSSVSLVKDGRIVADVQEERFTRTKHYCGLPIKAMQYSLDSQGMTIEDIDAVAIPTISAMPGLNFLLDLKHSRREKVITDSLLFQWAYSHILGRSTWTTPPLHLKSFPLPDKTPIYHVEHHLAHAASAYYTSGDFTGRQLIVTVDGLGDGFSVCLWRGENGKISELEKFPGEGSLGWFYGNVTEALGWRHGNGEGKTMGLAPYGDTEKVRGVLDGSYPRYSGGKLVEKHDFGRIGLWKEDGAPQWHLEGSRAIRDLVQQHGRANIAAEAQQVLETQVMEIVLPWMNREKTRRVCFAGGVFLNVKLNQRLWEKDVFEMQHIFPNTGDGGLAAGAALYTYYQMNPCAQPWKLDNIYLGPEYTDAQIKEVLAQRQLEYFETDNITSLVAEALAENKIVAWFNGRMESGPRALGSRSILMSPCKPENKDIINARVKFREAFRPFCPSLLHENWSDYLKNARPEEYMITSFDVSDSVRDLIPAVVHVDGTLRPQTVRKETNPAYYEVIRKFGEITGVNVILNTSFNIAGEPIINHPREAVRCFYDGGIDILIMGRYYLKKPC